MNKKKVFVLALAVCLIAILSMGSLAWFTDQKNVTNDFWIADSEDDTAEDIFSVAVWENTPDGEKDSDGHEYKDVLPGAKLKKEVKVENTGYYDQYIRVTVTVSDAAAWMDALGTNGRVPYLGEIVEGFDSADTWTSVDEPKVENDTIVYTLYYRNVLLGDENSDYDNSNFNSDVVTVFTSVVIPQSMTVEQAAAFDNNFQISVTATAVQTENLGIDKTNGVTDAVEAFAVVNP